MGDQPEAIRQLVEGVRAGQRAQVLQGVTGSGKTFTVANVIQQLGRPTLVMSHNKTLAAQLYGEFKQFFPNNAVEYFVSYYDYYQPEAYIPSTNTYIEKDLAINDELDKLRLRASSALLSGRRDVIVVSSVSCIYGIGNPDEFTILELGKLVYKTLGQKENFVYKSLPADDPCRRQPDIKLAREKLGWEPKISLHEGLAKTIEWFKQINVEDFRAPTPNY